MARIKLEQQNPSSHDLLLHRTIKKYSILMIVVIVANILIPTAKGNFTGIPSFPSWIMAFMYFLVFKAFRGDILKFSPVIPVTVMRFIYFAGYIIAKWINWYTFPILFIFDVLAIVAMIKFPQRIMYIDIDEDKILASKRRRKRVS